MVAPVGKVSVVDGNLSVMRAGGTRWEPAYNGMPIYAGDHVKTDEKSVAAIEISTRARLAVGYNEEYRLNADGSGDTVGTATNQTLVLKAGAVWCKFQTQEQPLNFQRMNATITIKG